MARKFIIAGRVCDPAWMPAPDGNGEPVDDGSEAPLLPMPPEIEHVRKKPLDTFTRISEEVGKASAR